MKFRSLKEFSSVRFGNVSVGDYIELDKGIAKQMVDMGYVELPSDVAADLRQKEVEAKEEKPIQKGKK